jgi:hypothetical protein
MSTLAKKPNKPAAPKRRHLPDLSGPVQRPAPGGPRKYKAEDLRKAVDTLFDKLASRAQA